MEIVDLRHLDNLKGNFILNEREYANIFTSPISKEEKIIPHIIHTSIKGIVEQQQFVFDIFWNKAISINEKLRR